MRPDEFSAALDVLDSGQYVLGDELAAFESELTDFTGLHSVGVGSGTDALVMALRAIGIKSGDEVLVPAISFFATAEAVCLVGAKPRFADIDPDTWNLSAPTVSQALTRKTKAILPVDLFGNPAPDLRAFDLPVIEDACQAIGATLGGKHVGHFADAAALSFYPSKTLAGIGDGGAVLTSDPQIAERIKSLRNHGERNGWHWTVGYNSRLDEIQAAVLRRRLPLLDIEGRRERADELRIEGYDLQAEVGQSSWHRYGVMVDTPDRYVDEFGWRRYYTRPLYAEPALKPYAPRHPLINAERFARHNVTIPANNVVRLAA